MDATWLLILVMSATNCSGGPKCGNQAALSMVTEKQCKSGLAYAKQYAKSVTCIAPDGETFVLRDEELFKSEPLTGKIK